MIKVNLWFVFFIYFISFCTASSVISYLTSSVKPLSVIIYILNVVSSSVVVNELLSIINSFWKLFNSSIFFLSFSLLLIWGMSTAVFNVDDFLFKEYEEENNLPPELKVNSIIEIKIL